MCRSTSDARTTLPVDDTAPRAARKFLREARCHAHHAEVLDEAELLVSEVVTNAVRHGSPPITLEVICDESEGLTVRVSDGTTALPQVPDHDPDRESGRGVALVDLLSSAWGVEPAEEGKAVWFRLHS